MVARAVAAWCRLAGDEVIGLGRDALDISDRDTVSATVGRLKPDVVFNCAAYTNVDGAETDPAACYAVNTAGVENLASACLEHDSRFVTISTDYVFDGERDGFYTQADEPNPQSVYATAKHKGELRAQDVNPRSIVVRSGWIFGHEGTNFLSEIRRHFAEGRPVRAISDAFGTPTFAGDLARRLYDLAELDRPGLYHVVNSGRGTSYFGFAEKVCELAGADPSLLVPVSDREMHRPARRPLNSRLACLASESAGLAPLPAWEASLACFLQTK